MTRKVELTDAWGDAPENPDAKLLRLEKEYDAVRALYESRKDAESWAGTLDQLCDVMTQLEGDIVSSRASTMAGLRIKGKVIARIADKPRPEHGRMDDIPMLWSLLADLGAGEAPVAEAGEPLPFESEAA